jgi:hypothetical protein
MFPISSKLPQRATLGATANLLGRRGDQVSAWPCSLNELHGRKDTALETLLGKSATADPLRRTSSGTHRL